MAHEVIFVSFEFRLATLLKSTETWEDVPMLIQLEYQRKPKKINRIGHFCFRLYCTAFFFLSCDFRRVGVKHDRSTVLREVSKLLSFLSSSFITHLGRKN